MERWPLMQDWEVSYTDRSLLAMCLWEIVVLAVTLILLVVAIVLWEQQRMRASKLTKHIRHLKRVLEEIDIDARQYLDDRNGSSLFHLDKPEVIQEFRNRARSAHLDVSWSHIISDLDPSRRRLL